jgi:hypothetical protein
LSYYLSGVIFNEEDELEGKQFKEYVPSDMEVEEQYFEYYLINNCTPEEIDIE